MWLLPALQLQDSDNYVLLVVYRLVFILTFFTALHDELKLQMLLLSDPLHGPRHPSTVVAGALGVPPEGGS